MKLFKCQACGNVLYFENRTCGHCSHRLAYLPEEFTISAVEPIDRDVCKPLACPVQQRVFCENAAQDGCNWLVPPGTKDRFCVACRHNGVIPDLSNPTHLAAWQQIELAKHRLFYSLLRWKLPLENVGHNGSKGLVFEFLADSAARNSPRVMTGHDEGKITIALNEASDAEREKRRVEMGEPYRTLLGHFRHEVGHYYWNILVRDHGELEAMSLSIRRRSCGLRRRSKATLRTRRAFQLARAFCFAIRDNSPLGGFCGDLGSLLTYCRHTRNSRDDWHVGQASS